MYTAYPDTEPETAPVVAPKAEINPRASLFSRIISYAENHSGEDFAGVTPIGEKTQYTEKHRNLKVKGGHAPVDFSLVETLVDLQSFVQQGLLEEAIPLYFRLKQYA